MQELSTGGAAGHSLSSSSAGQLSHCIIVGSVSVTDLLERQRSSNSSRLDQALAVYVTQRGCPSSQASDILDFDSINKSKKGEPLVH